MTSVVEPLTLELVHEQNWIHAEVSEVRPGIRALFVYRSVAVRDDDPIMSPVYEELRGAGYSMFVAGFPPVDDENMMFGSGKLELWAMCDHEGLVLGYSLCSLKTLLTEHVRGVYGGV